MSNCLNRVILGNLLSIFLCGIGRSMEPLATPAGSVYRLHRRYEATAIFEGEIQYLYH